MGRLGWEGLVRYDKEEHINGNWESLGCSTGLDAAITNVSEIHKVSKNTVRVVERGADRRIVFVLREGSTGPGAVPRCGTCCSCGTSAPEESPCPTRADRTHCEHWWDEPESP